MKVMTAGVVIAGLLACGVVFSDEGERYASNEVLVRYKSGASSAEIRKLRQSLHAKRLQKFAAIKVQHYKLPSNISVEEAVSQLQQSSKVLYAEPNYVVHMDQIPNDSSFNTQYALHNTGQTGGKSDADIDAPEAWDRTVGDPDIIVAVIDTGVDYDHPDLAENIWTNPNEIAGNNIDDDGNGYVDDIHGYDFANNDPNPMDDNEHGTHVAGIIGAIGNNQEGVAGVVWKVQIMALKFLDAEGSGYISDAVKALNYATEMGAALSNNSWGGGDYSETLRDAILANQEKGALFIAAAGNESLDNDIVLSYPASYDLENIISVAATDHNDQLAYFSNYGTTTVDLAAPGVSIYSTLPNKSYGFLSGTSMATPHVTGALALIKSQLPNLTNLELKQLLLNTADPIPALAGKVLTGGRLNVFNFMDNDFTAPAPVNDLTIEEVSLFQIKLRWTATGDDGTSGQATQYDLRYSTTPISEENWSSATRVYGLAQPQVSGSVESFVVSGLSPETPYYFSLKVSDNVGNSSGLSNVVTDKTPLATTLFQENFENGQNGWTAGGSSDQSLWHISSRKSFGPSNAFYYGQEKNGTYDTTNPNAGWLISPLISLEDAKSSTLVFHHFLETENFAPYDEARVQVSDDNGASWTSIYQSYSSYGKWEKVIVDLSTYDGKNILIKFMFDTVDAFYNGYEGWYVDSLEVLAEGKPDLTSPAAVTDLGATQSQKDSIQLEWTASGDDDTSGQASKYDLRYATEPLTESNFEAGIPVLGIPSPSPSGTRESFEVKGLQLDTPYYFALKVYDEASNASALSNVVMARTKMGPKLVLDPTSLPKVEVGKGKTTEETLTLRNEGDESLSYNLSVESSHVASASLPEPRIHSSSNRNSAYARGQILVKFKESTSTAKIHSFADQFHARTLKIFKEVGVHVIETSSERSAMELARSYLASGLVKYAEPNYRVQALATLPNDPKFSSLWSLHNTGQTSGTSDADIDAPEAWDKTQGSTNIIVAVIDTGVDYNHDDLKGNMWTNTLEIAGNNKDDDGNGYVDDVRGWNFEKKNNNPMDDNEHGTHVAGTIGAVGNNGIGITGINWKVKIMPLKFLDAEGSGYLSDAVEAIIYAADKGAKILNNSWGGGDYSQTLFDAIQYANSKHALFIAAAGNDGMDNDQTPSYPASYPVENVIAVAATDSNDELAYFSNYGQTTVHIAAPGVQIYSTLPSNQYGFLSGTSMATPHVSGACALVWASHPEWDHLQIKKQILAVDAISGLVGKVIAGGRLNVNRASEGLEEIPPDAVTDLKAKALSHSAIELTWTATGDDGSAGTATSYEIRFSNDPITDQNFSQAKSVKHNLIPQSPGSEEKLSIANLNPSTKYYFAIRVLDEASNSSGLSNIAEVTTQEAAVLFRDAMENPSKWTTTGLWHSSTYRAHSPVASFYYGDENWRDYDTGGTHSGTLTSPTIDLTTGIAPQLTFQYWREVEPFFYTVDKTYLEVSKDGGATWTTLWYKDARDASEKAWTTAGPFDLTSYKGHKIILRFVFDTVDLYLNFYEGFYVDDLEILDQKPALGWLSVEPQSGSIPAQESSPIKLIYNSANLEAGSYQSMLKIVSNDPRNLALELPVEMEVIEDLTPPSAIVDLAMDKLTSASLDLVWTAPGDDGTDGKATTYDIRFSNSPITVDNFSEATPLPFPSAPQPSGNQETLTVTSLDLLNQDYSFALKAVDEKGNISDLSNTLVWYRSGDLDEDGLSNVEELTMGSSPARLDTDDDGVNDLLEEVSGTRSSDSNSYRATIFDDDFSDPSLKDWSINGVNVWSISEKGLKSVGTGSSSSLTVQRDKLSRLKSFAIEYRVEFPKKGLGGIQVGDTQFDINPYKIALRGSSVSKPGLKLGASDVLLLIRNDGSASRCSIYVNAILVLETALAPEALKNDSISILSPYISGSVAYYQHVTLWPDPDLALKPFVDNFNKTSFGRWIASGNTSGISWGFKSQALQARPLRSGSGYGYLNHALIDVQDRDLLVRSRIFYGDGARWGGFRYRGVHLDCNPSRIGLRDSTPTYVKPGLSANTWHNVVFVVRHYDSEDRLTLWLDGIETLPNESIEVKGDYKNTLVGFASNFYKGYVLFDDVEMTTVKPGENLQPLLFLPSSKKVKAGSTLTLQLKAVDADRDRLTYRALSLPPGSTFDASTGKFRWVTTPADARSKDYELIFEVSDGVKTDRKKMRVKLI